MALPTSLKVSPQDLGDLHADLYGPRTASPAFPGMARSPQQAGSSRYSGGGRARRGQQASSRLQKDSRAASMGFATSQSGSAAAPVDAGQDEEDVVVQDQMDLGGAEPSGTFVDQLLFAAPHVMTLPSCNAAGFEKRQAARGYQRKIR